MSQRQEGKAPRASSDISPRMLLITAGASALAAVIISNVWPGGTIIGASLTPVLVAVFKEGMRRPTEKVASRLRTPSAPRRPPTRPARVTSAQRLPDSEHEGPGEWTEITLRAENGEAPPQEPPPQEPPAEEPPPERRRLRFHMTPRAWKIAVITGLLGFVIAAAVITLPELLFGKSLSGGTTLTYFPNTNVSRSNDTTDTKTTTTDKTATSGTASTSSNTTPTTSTATSTTSTTTTGTDTTGTSATDTTDQNTQPSLAPAPAGATDTTGTGTTGTPPGPSAPSP